VPLSLCVKNPLRPYEKTLFVVGGADALSRVPTTPFFAAFYFFSKPLCASVPLSLCVKNPLRPYEETLFVVGGADEMYLVPTTPIFRGV